MSQQAVSQQEVLRSAQQGDAQAIAVLLNQALEPKQVRARVVLKQQDLHILLEATPTPEAHLAALIHQGVDQLHLERVRSLYVYGRQRGEQTPQWQRVWRLGSAAATPSIPPSSAAQPSNVPHVTRLPQPQGKVTLPPLQLQPHVQPHVQPSTQPQPSVHANGTQDPSAPLEPVLSEEEIFDLSSFYTASSTPSPKPRHFTVSLPPSSGLAADATSSPAVAPALASRRNRYLVPLAFSAGFVLGAGWHHLMSSPLGKVSNASGNAPATPLPASSMPAGKAVAIDRSIALASEPTATPPVPDPSNPTESTEVVADLAAAKPTQPVLTIKAVGDIILGTNFPGDRLPGNAQSLFDNVKPFFEGADILFGNFESTLTDYPYTAKDTSRGQTFAFRTPPSYASVLQQVGFDVLSVANNHSFDFGDQGFADTIANIQNAGMQAVGRKGDIIYQKVNGITVAFIGFSYLPDHNAMQDLAAAKALVDEANRNANIVVISVHAGAEGTDAVHTKNETEYFFGEDRGNLVEFAHAMIDQGADLILGHGPHVPRAMELYKSRLIAYSLGNFVGYRTLSTEGTLSYSLILQAQLDAQGGFIEGKVIPVRLDAQGVPYVDDYFQSVALVRNLIESDFPVTPLLIGNDGKIIKNEAPLPTGG